MMPNGIAFTFTFLLSSRGGLQQQAVCTCALYTRLHDALVRHHTPGDRTTLNTNLTGNLNLLKDCETCTPASNEPVYQLVINNTRRRRYMMQRYLPPWIIRLLLLVYLTTNW